MGDGWMIHLLFSVYWIFCVNGVDGTYILWYDW